MLVRCLSLFSQSDSPAPNDRKDSLGQASPWESALDSNSVVAALAKTHRNSFGDSAALALEALGPWLCAPSFRMARHYRERASVAPAFNR